ncbi:hypothetical protein MAV100_25810 [Mycobacterium avium subsp. hominissuis 100]|nr:hypothetical protein MAV100_25810 [Mycobacterium avium subsp. hominissuis 100]
MRWAACATDISVAGFQHQHAVRLLVREIGRVQVVGKRDAAVAVGADQFRVWPAG